MRAQQDESSSGLDADVPQTTEAHAGLFRQQAVDHHHARLSEEPVGSSWRIGVAAAATAALLSALTLSWWLTHWSLDPGASARMLLDWLIARLGGGPGP